MICGKYGKYRCIAGAGRHGDAKIQCRYRGRGSRGAQLLVGVKGRNQPLAGRDEAEYLSAQKRALSGGEKRFRKTARKERVHTVGGENGFVENSRQESKRRKSNRIKIPPLSACQTLKNAADKRCFAETYQVR